MSLFTSGRFKSWLATGAVNAGGRLYTYASGTTTFKTAYVDAAATIPATYTPDGFGGSYILLDSRGEAQVWLGVGAYTFVEKTSTGAALLTTNGVVSALDSTLLDIDPLLAANSDARVASQKAVKTYADVIGTRAPMRSVKSFGAVGDGIADDTVALQAALDSNLTVSVPPGRYRVTSSLILDPIRNRGSGFVGVSQWSNYPTTVQPGGPVWNGILESCVVYDGPASDTTAVLLASPDAVGVEPISAFNTTVIGFVLRNLCIDGGGKAGYGFYGCRLTEPDVFNVCVRGTTKHAWYLNGIYSGQFSKISAVFNIGCGISAGRGGYDFAWTSNYQINGVVFDDLYATTNGADKAFDETTNPLWGYGVGLWLHRGNVVTGYTSELNDGPALVLSPSSGPNTILSGYSELSSGYVVGGTTALVDGRASRAWGVWFQGQAAGISLSCRISSVFGASEAVKLSGTEPSAGRPQQGLELHNLSGFASGSAAWGNYRLVNCSNELNDNMSTTQPAGASLHAGGIKFATSGEVLNSYEEGTWTPTLAGSTTAGTGWTYTVNAASYTRIGRQVSYSAYVSVSAIGAAAAGNVLLGGLPFTVKNGSNYYSAAAVTQAVNLTTAVVSLTAKAEINTTTLTLWKRTAAAVSEVQAVIGDLSNTTGFILSGNYVAA